LRVDRTGLVSSSPSSSLLLPLSIACCPGRTTISSRAGTGGARHRWRRCHRPLWRRSGSASGGGTREQPKCGEVTDGTTAECAAASLALSSSSSSSPRCECPAALCRRAIRARRRRRPAPAPRRPKRSWTTSSPRTPP
jgi:hypothetical protein